MRKIQTIFDRNWEGNRGVIDKPLVDLEDLKENFLATEKVDGTNVRLTIRGGKCIRLEKRKNPTKEMKKAGITLPWYLEANEGDPADKWLFDAVSNTYFLAVIDGDYSGEVFGPNIQGNPLKVISNRVFLFGYEPELSFRNYPDCPTEFYALKDWLHSARSTFNIDCGIEGIVWWNPVNGERYKIKKKDFK